LSLCVPPLLARSLGAPWGSLAAAPSGVVSLAAVARARAARCLPSRQSPHRRRARPSLSLSSVHTRVQAAANAKHNSKAMKTKLFVAECFADGGPTYKRFQERAKGSAYRINKPTFHLTIRVEERQ